MSVTTPIFRSDVAACEAGADGVVDASVDGAAVEGAGACEAAGGVGVAAVPHAATMMARLPNSDRPSERLCMCPPPASSAVRPVADRGVRDGLEGTFAPRSDHRRILATRVRPG